MTLNININVDTAALQSFDRNNRLAQRQRLIEKEEEVKVKSEAGRRIGRAVQQRQAAQVASQAARRVGTATERLRERPAARRYDTGAKPFFVILNEDQSSLPDKFYNGNSDLEIIYKNTPIFTAMFLGVEYYVYYICAWDAEAIKVAREYIEYRLNQPVVTNLWTRVAIGSTYIPPGVTYDQGEIKERKTEEQVINGQTFEVQYVRFSIVTADGQPYPFISRWTTIEDYNLIPQDGYGYNGYYNERYEYVISGQKVEITENYEIYEIRVPGRPPVLWDPSGQDPYEPVPEEYYVPLRVRAVANDSTYYGGGLLNGVVFRGKLYNWVSDGFTFPVEEELELFFLPFFAGDGTDTLYYPVEE